MPFIPDKPTTSFIPEVEKPIVPELTKSFIPDKLSVFQRAIERVKKLRIKRERVPSKTILSPTEETQFRKDYTQYARRVGVNLDPDAPKHYYDYRGAWKKQDLVPDETGHLPSEFKLPGHPRLIIGGIDTRTGKPVPEPPIITRPLKAPPVTYRGPTIPASQYEIAEGQAAQRLRASISEAVTGKAFTRTGIKYADSIADTLLREFTYPLAKFIPGAKEKLERSRKVTDFWAKKAKEEDIDLFRPIQALAYAVTGSQLLRGFPEIARLARARAIPRKTLYRRLYRTLKTPEEKYEIGRKFVDYLDPKQKKEVIDAYRTITAKTMAEARARAGIYPLALPPGRPMPPPTVVKPPVAPRVPVPPPTPVARPPVTPAPLAVVPTPPPITPRPPITPAIPPIPPVPAIVPPVVPPPTVPEVVAPPTPPERPIVAKPTPTFIEDRPPVPEVVKKVFFGGRPLNIKEITEKGISVSTEKSIADKFAKISDGKTQELIIDEKAKTLEYENIPKKYIRYSRFLEAETPIDKTGEAIIKYAKKEGYDVVDLKGFGEGEIRVINPNVITKIKPEVRPPEVVPPVVKPEVPPIRREAVIFPKGRKELLTDITAKIKQAPGIITEVEKQTTQLQKAGLDIEKDVVKEITGKEPETIKFQVDGGYNIVNTKEALWEFHKRIRVTPERVPIAPEIPKERISVRPPKRPLLVKEFETEISDLRTQIAETVSKTKLARLNERLSIAEENLTEAKALREKSTNDRIYDIVRTSESMFEAQKMIKKNLDMNIPISDLKSFEPQVKGGLPVDASEHIVKDLRGKIKQTEKKDVMNFGVSEVANISAEDLVDSMTFIDRAKDYTTTKYTQLKEAIHSVELAQNYLYSYPESKPVAEGMIDAQVKQLRKSNDINEAMVVINKATNKDKVAEILVEADRKERIDGDIDNVISKVNEGIEKGTMTQKDKDAIRALGALRKVVKEQIITDILESRVGVRVKSDGMRYDITYINPKGKTIERRGITEITLDKLTRMHRNVTIIDQNERVTFRHLDPKTGKYVARTELVKDYDEVTKILGKETQAIIKETLPYVNWIPHNRIYGKYWVEAYEPLAAGTGETKIFSARVPNKLWADKMQSEIKKKFPSARIDVKPHSTKMKYMPSFGSMVEVSHYLHRAGVDPRSEAGQKIINAYRSMSGLMNSLIHSQNVAGYRVDFEGLVEGMERKATSAVNRGFRQEAKDLLDYTKDIKDDFRYNVAVKYINAMSSVTQGNVVLDAAKALTYFWVLANKGTYIIQNLTESLWALARVPKLNKPLRFMLPLSKEYKVLAERAKKQGIIRPFYGEQITGRGLLYNINVLGNWSENESSKRVFNTGLRVARDKGLTGDEAYKEAYQFLFNVGKPYYRNPNTLITLLGKEGTIVNKYGFIFLRWVLDWINKTVRLPLRGKLKTLLVWFLLGGAGTLPYGRKILNKLGLVDIRKDPKRLTLFEKALLGGLPGALGVSSRFLIPMFYKGLGEVRTGVERGFNILSGQIRRGKAGYSKYGTVGVLGSAPLGGFQYPISGITKVRKGIIEVRGKKRKVIYKPKSLAEKIVTGVGLTPFELSQIYQQKREPKPKPRIFR